MKIKWMNRKSILDGRTMGNEYGWTPFLQSYSSIVHSSQFRRLSHKTQVYINPNSDYVRTRLTHSIEVSQIGMQLAKIFTNKFKIEESSENFNFAEDFCHLTSTACLAHDIGHPPFGHAGERILNEKVKQYNLNFEGNKQNIRLLLGSEARQGINVTISVLDAIIKYKSKNLFPKKYGYYPSEIKKIEALSIDPCYRHPACYLMEAADDIANLCGDLEDAIKLKIIDKDYLIKNLDFIPILDEKYNVADSSTWESIIYKHWDNPSQITSYVMKALIKNIEASLEEFKNQDFPSTNLTEDQINSLSRKLHEYVLNIQKNYTIDDFKEHLNILYTGDQSFSKKLMHLKNDLYRNKILSSSIIGEAEFIGSKIVSDLFDIFIKLSTHSNAKDLKNDNLYKIIPKHIQDKLDTDDILKSPEKDALIARLVADYISGMTDRYAINLWEKLNLANKIKIAS